MSHIFVQTRGKNTDYAFLGGAPSKLWWLDFRDATSFEQPTIIVRGDGSEWGCFVSGIPSGRRDRVGTIIRYSLVLGGPCDKEGRNSALALNLLADALTGQRVQAKLDDKFDEATVERLLSSRGANPDDRGEVGRLAAEALSNLEPLKSHMKLTKPTEAESWVGSSTSISAQSEFIARSEELFRGERQGEAALLNLLGTEDEASKLLEQQAVSLAVLIKEDSPGTLAHNVVPISSKKKASCSSKPSPSPQSQEIPTILLAAVAIVVVVAVLAIWPNNPTTPQPQPPTNQR
jgi:hypothetical protein